MAVAAMAAFLGGCQNGSQLQAIDVPAISAVQSDLKRQIAIHKAFAQLPMQIAIRTPSGGRQYVDIDRLPVPDGKDIWACGTGEVGFEIVSVEAELTTTLERSVSVNAGLSPQYAGLKITGKAGATRTVGNTQKLNYNVYPADYDVSRIQVSRELVNANPVAQVLTDLREALVASATRYDYSQYPPVLRPPTACVTGFNKDKLDDPGGTYSLGLSIEANDNGGVTINLAVVELGIEGTYKSITGHSLTVTFRQANLDEVRQAHDEVARQCAPPHENSAACRNAKSNEKNVVDKYSYRAPIVVSSGGLASLRRLLGGIPRGRGAPIIVVPMSSTAADQAPGRPRHRRPPAG